MSVNANTEVVQEKRRRILNREAVKHLLTRPKRRATSAGQVKDNVIVFVPPYARRMSSAHANAFFRNSDSPDVA